MMFRAKWFYLLILAGCAREPAHEQVHEKPMAAVDVAIAQRELGGGRFEVTLTATALRDAPALELALDGKTVQVGPVHAGDVRTTTAIIRVGAVGRTVAGGAVVGTGPHRRNKAATVTIGELPAAKPIATRIIVMPDGTQVEEVRP